MKQVTCIVNLIFIAHEVLVEQPDIVQSIKESDIIEDDHHNVEDVYNSDV